MNMQRRRSGYAEMLFWIPYAKTCSGYAKTIIDCEGCMDVAGPKVTQDMTRARCSGYAKSIIECGGCVVLAWSKATRKMTRARRLEYAQTICTTDERKKGRKVTSSM